MIRNNKIDIGKRNDGTGLRMVGPVAEIPKLWSLLESPRKQIQEIAGPSPRAPNLACVVLCTYENFS